jgi:hypothetical protein
MKRRAEMTEKSGWLGRSLERARQNIEERPEYLKPERYRTKKAGVAVATSKKRSTGRGTV